MKKEQKLRLSLQKIKQRYPLLKQEASRAKYRGLLHTEAAVRDQIRHLREIGDNLPGYQPVYEAYTALLDDISVRLLALHNQKNHTDYSFDSVVAEDREGYLKAGILSVLVTHHIPRILSAEFHRLLPQYPQEEYPAARARARTFFLHLGDTNTGKTYHAIERMKQAENGVYLAPLRILALENFERLNREGVPCSLLTGEEEIRIPGARHLCCTVEKANLDHCCDVAVIDEVQLTGDAQRGDAWTRAILGLNCPEIHLCGARLVKDQLLAMIRDCGDTWVLNEYTRLVPLEIEHKPIKLSSVQRGDALVAFSKRGVLALSQQLKELGIRSSVIYGDLPPEVRRLQYDAFTRGENPVLVATDAIGMGVNLPIRRLIFTGIEKFDGESFRLLTTQEVKQIAGRAGRIGIYDIGYVGCLDERDIYLIEERLHAEDEPTEYAVVGPSDAILKIGLLPLREKLALWSIEPESLPYYRKKDVRDYILLLDLLHPYHLPQEIQWRLMRIPFDLANEVLLRQFSGYIHQCFSVEAIQMEKPPPCGPTCSDYETYYQQINLYYSFSKTMELPFDEAWVARARAQTSARIQSLVTVGQKNRARNRT